MHGIIIKQEWQEVCALVYVILFKIVAWNYTYDDDGKSWDKKFWTAVTKMPTGTSGLFGRCDRAWGLAIMQLNSYLRILYARRVERTSQYAWDFDMFL